jgi:MOSC domain-containing protein YiiM
MSQMSQTSQTMTLISVNIGKARTIANAKSVGQTGIYKLPIHTPVEISQLGLMGDAICDAESHGGPDQAVYIFGAADYAWWSQALGRDLPPGTFGENLTITYLESAGLSIGDRLHLAQVTLEITAPRIPCVTLAARMGDPAFIKRFRTAERPGVYCRVIQEGAVCVGDAVSYEPYAGPTVTAIEMFRDFYTPDLNETTLRRYLAAPIAIRARMDKEKRLRELLTS